MSKQRIGTAAIIMTCTGIACGGTESAETTSVSAARTEQEVPVYSLADLSDAGGEAELERQKRRIEFEIEAKGLPAGHAMSVWTCGFNNPDACENPFPLGGCSLPDLFIEGPEGFCQWAGVGGVVNRKGHLEVEGENRVGAPPGEVIVGEGLTNPLGAEIHFIIRSHGPAIAGQVEAQTNTFMGGCDVNECVDLQFAPFLP